MTSNRISSALRMYLATHPITALISMKGASRMTKYVVLK